MKKNTLRKKGKKTLTRREYVEAYFGNRTEAEKLLRYCAADCRDAADLLRDAANFFDTASNHQHLTDKYGDGNKVGRYQSSKAALGKIRRALKLIYDLAPTIHTEIGGPIAFMDAEEVITYKSKSAQ